MMVLCCMGAKDGVGVTDFVATLGRVATGRLLVIDADPMHGGDLAPLLGLTAFRSYDTVMAQRGRLDPSRLRGYLRVSDGDMGGLHFAGDDDVTRLAALFALLERTYDAVLIDGGAHCAPSNVLLWYFTSHWLCLLRPDDVHVRAAARRLHEWKRVMVPQHAVIPLVVDSFDDAALSSTDIEAALGVPIVHRFDGKARHPERLLTQWVSQWQCTPGAGRGQVHPQRLLAAVPLLPAQSPCEVSIDRECLKAELLERFFAQLTDGELEQLHPDAAQRRQRVESRLHTLIDAGTEEALAGAERAVLIDALLDDALGLGPLEPYLADPTVSEIMVNGTASIYIERGGCLERTSDRVCSLPQLRRFIDRLIAPTGRRVDESSPMVDARTADGARIHIILPPLAVNGPFITIRRFAAEPWTLSRLVEAHTVSQVVADRLERAVRERRNLLIIGGTGSGKTTLLGALSGAIPASERIVTIEDAAELQLQQPHVVRLETRPPNVSGAGAVVIRDLVRTALRMRPDRIVVGECRGGEALDMLQAMQTGHSGSMTTLHANSPRDAIERLATLVTFAGAELPLRSIYAQIAGAIDCIVEVQRLANGRRVVTSVADLLGMEQETVRLEVWDDV